jgi:hypothetical protein
LPVDKKKSGPIATVEVQRLTPIDLRPPWHIGWHEGYEVVFLQPQPRVRVPIVAGRGRISPLIVGGIVGRGAKAGTYEVVMIQRQPDGAISGSATLILKIGKVF